MTLSLEKGETLAKNTDTCTGKTPCDNESRDGDGYPAVAANHQKLGDRHGAGPPSQPRKHITLLTPPSQKSRRQDHGMLHFFCQSPPTLCYIVAAALRNSYNDLGPEVTQRFFQMPSVRSQALSPAWAPPRERRTLGCSKTAPGPRDASGTP